MEKGKNLAKIPIIGKVIPQLLTTFGDLQGHQGE